MFKAKKADKQIRAFIRNFPYMLSYTLGFLVGYSAMKARDCDAARREELMQYKLHRQYGI